MESGSAQSAKQNRGRIPGLDGLRAICALLVVFFHLGLVNSGWMGVEVFFVLSGFLITRILIDSVEAAPDIRTYLGRFFWRRTIRIFPLYYAVVFIELTWKIARGHWPLTPALARATYTYNWYRAFHRWEPTHYANHFWSLASEEQFYLVWPFAVYFLYRRGWLPKFSIALIVAGVGMRIAGLWVLPPAVNAWIVYHAGIFQIGALATGAALACGVISHLRRVSLWAAALGIAAVIAGAISSGFTDSLGFGVMMRARHQWIWGYAAIDLVAAALILACVQHENIIQALEWRPLRRLGQVSYGFYVFHPFVIGAVLILITRYSLPRVLLAPAGILLTWMAAELSFTGFESRFLRMRDRYWSEKAAPATRAVAEATASETGYGVLEPLPESE